MDKHKLDYIIKCQNKTIDDVCEYIHISKSAYYRKIKGSTQFTREEIQGIMDYLGLASPMGIFFHEGVA